MSRHRFNRKSRPSRWLPDPGPQARQLATMYCPCGAVRPVGKVVCHRCWTNAPAEMRNTYDDRRTRQAGIRLLLDFARTQIRIEITGKEAIRTPPKPKRLPEKAGPDAHGDMGV